MSLHIQILSRAMLLALGLSFGARPATGQARSRAGEVPPDRTQAIREAETSSLEADYETFLFTGIPPGVTPSQPPRATPLVRALGLEDSPIKLYGWIENSFTGNPAQPADGINFGVYPDYLANRWMGNQYYLIIEDALEHEGEFNLGFRADNLFGHDWYFNRMKGLTPNFGRGNLGYDPTQFFISAHLPVITEKGLDVRFGRFYSIDGYEQVPAIARPFLSVPYLFNYGQPFTHFGALSSLYLDDRTTLYLGLVNGWDRFLGPHQRWGELASLSRTSESGRFKINQGLYLGPNQATMPPNGTLPDDPHRPGFFNGDRFLSTTVLFARWNDRLTQIFEFDFAFETNSPNMLSASGRSRDAWWYGFASWFLYDMNAQWMFAWRAEVWRDAQGVRTGYADTFYEQTLGLIYKPVEWLWVRPTVRFDWAQFTHPYNGGVSGGQFTLGGDIIVFY